MPLPREKSVRLLSPAALAVALLISGLASAWPVAATHCEFISGFESLRDAVPEVVGECLENVRYDPATGDAYQMTAAGMLFWRKADNHTAFTDGYRTWVSGPSGVEQRLNAESFLWETAQYLRNAEYRLPDAPTGRIRVVDGEYLSEPDRVRAGLLSNLVAVGDLDGDGVADAAAVVHLNTGGSGTFIYLMLFVGRGGDLVQVGREFLGDRVRVQRLGVSGNGIVTLDMIAHGPGEPLCCPTQRVVKRFWLRILVESPKPFEEASLPLRITGVARSTEGNVRLRIRDARRGILVDTFTTARMPDVGAYGPFEFVIPESALASHRNTRVTLELFEESALDGSLLGLSDVPVRLK